MFLFLIISVIISNLSSVNCESKMLNVREHRNWPKSLEGECGISYADRIIGGINASLGQYPWLARIGYKSKVVFY